MASLYSVGNDGTVDLPSNYDFNIKVWAANISYVSSDTTGFGHAAKTRRLGVLDITGSLAGTPIVGSVGPFNGTNMTNVQHGGSLVLSNYGGTATSSAANITFDAVFSSFAFNTDKNGDATLSLNFELNDSNGPTIVWSTSI